MQCVCVCVMVYFRQCRYSIEPLSPKRISTLTKVCSTCTVRNVFKKLSSHSTVRKGFYKYGFSQYSERCFHCSVLSQYRERYFQGSQRLLYIFYIFLYKMCVFGSADIPLSRYHPREFPLLPRCAVCVCLCVLATECRYFTLKNFHCRGYVMYRWCEIWITMY
jgi:hypothetical protein